MKILEIRKIDHFFEILIFDTGATWGAQIVYIGVFWGPKSISGIRFGLGHHFYAELEPCWTWKFFGLSDILAHFGGGLSPALGK